MSRSDPPNPPARPVTGLEIVCVAVMPMLWYSLLYAILESANFFAWFYGADALAADALKKVPLMPSRQGLWITAISAPFLIASALTFLAAGVGVPLDEIGLTTRNLGRNVLAGLLFAFIFVPGSLGIQQLALMALEAAGSKPVEHPFTQIGKTGLLPAEWGLLLFTAVVVAPVWEELVFRGLIQPWVMRNGRRGALVALGLAVLLAGYGLVRAWAPAPTALEVAVKLAPFWFLALLVGVYFLVERRDAAWGGLFASAVLFAWIHVGVWPSPVPLVWLALGLGWLAWRGRSLVGAVVLHAVFNAVACVALWYAPSVENDKIPIPPAIVRQARKPDVPPRRPTMSPLVLSFLALLSAAPEKPTPKEVFEKRILPIFASPDPSSCVQCHLSGVALKNYILPSSEQTFASLRDQGLIDLDRPEKSKILALIRMGKDEKGAEARVHAKVRDAEYEAFADWIARSAADPKMRALPKLAAGKEAKPKRPVEVIRHARKDRVLESFTNNIWPMRFRCMNCHTEGESANEKLVEEHGERVAWFKAAGPEATLAYLRTSKLLDVDAPEKSLLLRKPLNDVKHGGGKKFVVGDQGYKAFRAFLEDYARIVKDGYPDADSLPKAKDTPLAFGSDIWLKLTNTPPAWGDKLLQVDLYAWDAERKAWGTLSIATSDRIVWGKGKLWQHNLTLQAAKGSPLAVAWKKGKATLPRGRYRVEIRVDGAGRAAKDWAAGLGAKDLVGRVEVTSAWPEGYGKMTAVDASKVKE